MNYEIVKLQETRFWNFVSKMYNVNTPKNTIKPELPFDSFLLAAQFLDQLDKIDLISSAETLKNLSKLALSYSNKIKNDFNFIIHCVGDTLLVDNFELEQQRSTPKGAKKQRAKNESISEPKSYSEFLGQMYKFYSDAEKLGLIDKDKKNQVQSVVSKLKAIGNSQKNSSIPLPLPKMASSLIPTSSSSSFLHNSQWTFEDLSLLTGSNLRIFGDGKDSPAVTIQLAEHETPINILTGVDCWLDNLICDVPEVVMFFHDNGFLTNFEKIPTDQIPNVAEFNPDTVRDRSLNI